MYNFSWFLYKVPGTSQIRSQVMQSLTPGSHEMNSVSDSSVHHQQTVEAGEPSQHFPHTTTIPPFINQGMYCKSSDPHSHHEEQNIN